VAASPVAQVPVSAAGSKIVISRLEKFGVRAVSGRTFEAVISALREAGVEIEGDTLRLVKKPKR
jgi:hypothetical protein